MVKWLLPRGDKETRTCDSCGSYKMRAKFYNWYHHPALSFLEDERIGVICTPCARREAGSNNWVLLRDQQAGRGSDHGYRETKCPLPKF